MGYGEFGGNGSVDWKVDVDDETASNKKRASAFGRDPKVTTDFTVTFDFSDNSLAQGAWANIRAAIGKVGTNDRKLVFKVPVEAQNGDQIRVEW